MLWTVAALVVVIAAGIVATRSGERDRRRAMRGSLVLCALGSALPLAAYFTGNLALFYGGAFISLVAWPLLFLLMVLVYRDRQHRLYEPAVGVDL